MSQFQQTNTLVLTSCQSDLCLFLFASSLDFLNQRFPSDISPTVNFSNDIVLKSTVELVFSPTTLFFQKKCCRHLPCCSFHDLLAVLLGSSYADACSDFGSSKREHSLGNIAWDKTL